MSNQSQGSAQTPLIGDALAIGGLGGFNGFGAGTLHALEDACRTPGAISCTSGAIYWTAIYLARRHAAAGRRTSRLNPDNRTIKDKLKEEVDQQIDIPWKDLRLLYLAWNGLPGVFEPTMRDWRYPLQFLSLLTPATPLRALADREAWLAEWAAKTFPARAAIPTRPDWFYDEVSDIFNAETEVAVVFNAFDLQAGIERLFVNEPGRVALGEDRRPNAPPLLPINAAAVRAALHLFWYGFEPTYDGRVVIDGAYHRQLIVRELYRWTRIVTIKPQNDRWIGEMPQSLFGSMDLETELWFNAPFARELAELDHINEMVKADAEVHGADHKTHRLVIGRDALERSYRFLDIVKIQSEHQAGFLDYFHETLERFEEARVLAAKVFRSPE